MSVDQQAVLQVKGISKMLGGKPILDNCSLTVNRGELKVLIGPSGAGKSTFLQSINCLIPPDSGEIYLEGQLLNRTDKAALCAFRAQVGMIFQDFNLFDHLTAEENVAIALRKVRGMSAADARARAQEELARVGLARRASLYPAQLSGGQKQRVAIARALATRPKYLLCDEATSALDPNTTQSILHLLKEINQTLGVTIVVITHEMRVIEQICQRVAVIDQSCIAEIGNVSDVFTHPKSDIAKALILPKSPAENLPPCTGRRLRLVFDGSCSNEPVISRITLECHVPVNILFADTRIVEGSIYGHMVIDLPDDPQQFHDVLRWLDHNHISYLQEDGSHV